MSPPKADGTTCCKGNDGTSKGDGFVSRAHGNGESQVVQPRKRRRLSMQLVESVFGAGVLGMGGMEGGRAGGQGGSSSGSGSSSSDDTPDTRGTPTQHHKTGRSTPAHHNTAADTPTRHHKTGRGQPTHHNTAADTPALKHAAPESGEGATSACTAVSYGLSAAARPLAPVAVVEVLSTAAEAEACAGGGGGGVGLGRRPPASGRVQRAGGVGGDQGVEWGQVQRAGGMAASQGMEVRSGAGGGVAGNQGVEDSQMSQAWVDTEERAALQTASKFWPLM